MEDFITDLYKSSFIISGFKKYLDLISRGCLGDARDLYNDTASKLEDWLKELSSYDLQTACEVQDIALDIRSSYEDYAKTTGLIEGRLLPTLYSSLKPMNTINVTEDIYTLKSSDSAYLTIYDSKRSLHLHDIHDPMQEAYRLVRNIYKPEHEEFLILGSGLGYLPYQIFDQSTGATNIYLYEEDDTMIRYAYSYGVLSLIPDDKITIICNPDKERLASQFVDHLKASAHSGFYIAPDKRSIYDGVLNGELNRIAANNDLYRFADHNKRINLWKNKKLERADFSDITRHFKYDEWIVISAGPSLDDCIPFLLESQGIRGMIAVNTVHKRLAKEGIVPDMMAAADASTELERHIKGMEKNTAGIPLIADWLLSWKYTYLYMGDLCFVRTNESEAMTRNMLPESEVWDVSGTVASLALEAVARLNPKKIYLVGQDLAYPDGRMYAKNMPYDENTVKHWNMKVPSVDGGMVDTCEAFVWFRKALEYQIGKYSHIEFINMSKHGAYIAGARHL